ncbi:MAG: hypothetical protein IJX67_05575 [Oscillospiraceae bacterium]|nr:hypothetical protein [Oscillospiraceae bacterium]
MRGIIEKILNCYGLSVLLPRIDGEVRAFLQPVTSSSKKAQGDVCPLGQVPEGQYTYIGPAEPGVQVGDQLEFGGKLYLFRQVEQMNDKNGPVYCWGMCVEKGSEDIWGTQS